jgi:hypothetical protein
LEQFIAKNGYHKRQYTYTLDPLSVEETPGNKVFYNYCASIGKSVMAEHKDPQNFCNRPPPDLLNIATISTTAKQLAHAKLELEAPSRKFKRKQEDEGSGGQLPAPPGGGDKGGSGGQGGRLQGSSRGGNKGGKGKPTSVGTDAEP